MDNRIIGVKVASYGRRSRRVSQSVVVYGDQISGLNGWPKGEKLFKDALLGTDYLRAKGWRRWKQRVSLRLLKILGKNLRKRFNVSLSDECWE